MSESSSPSSSSSSSESSESNESSREQLPLSNNEQGEGLASSQVPLILPIEDAENRAVEPATQKKNYKVYVNEQPEVLEKEEVSSNKRHRKRCLRCLQKFKIVPRVKNNSIRTSRYTGVNYFPWVLARQFRRPANVFFLAVMIITFTPVSPLDPVTWTAFFLLVLLASVVKEGIEDIIRHRNDKKVNHRPVTAWRNGEEIRTRWAKLIPGDILKIRDGEEIPADLVVLSTSQKNGQCYVSTVNLDGESALKTRQAVKTTHPYSEENLVGAKMLLSVDDPSPSLTSFSGYIQVSDQERYEKSPVDLNNMLMRGTLLRNTEYAYGVIVYAGKNTKYAHNSKRGASKRSTVEQSYDKYIIGNLIALGVVAFAYSVYSTIFQQRNLTGHWYLPPVTDLPVFGVSIFFTYVSLLAVFIPLPLYVTLEIVRAGQFRLFGWEKYLYDAKKDFRPVSRSLNLHEDLGQIQYIFSDKTGTLTKNKMILNTLNIGEESYKNNRKLPALEVDDEWRAIAPIRNQRFEWNDEDLVKRLKALSTSSNYETDPLYLSLLTIALCHSANVFDKIVDEHTDIVFHASSPDEKALLEAAQNFGFCFVARDFDAVKLNVFGKPVLFTVLHTLEFSGERKRMSVIVQDDNGRIMLLTKGADAVVLTRTAKDQPLVSAAVAQDQADKMANDCLRSLVLAYKELSREHYNEWYNTYWKKSIEDFANRHAIIDKASEIIETDLQILGVTGVEDELQDNVPITISRLLHAGIKIWVVTGDKQETAFNIAVACSLVHEASTVFLHVKSHDEKGNIAATLEKVKALRQESPESEGTHDLIEHSEWVANRAAVKRVGLVFDGETLDFCLEHYWKEILPLMTQCDSVLVCRASPLQKEKVVRNVKKYDKEAVALAIGDGGNDVSMLHAADVGVGVPGEEGSQALMAADFQIGQFELLDDLILVKGRYFYLQMCIFMYYFCYKSLVAIICRFLFVPFAAWSGTSFLNDLIGSFYQLFFTSVPILLSGIFEEDISPSWLLRYPQLYKECVKKLFFNIKIYLLWILLAIYQGVVCWGVAIMTFNEAAGRDGKYPGLLGESTVNISYVVVVANLQLGRVLKRWVYPHHITVYGSIVAYVIVTVISSFFRSSALHLISQWMFLQPAFYIGLVVCIVACLLPEVLVSYIQRNYYPRLSDIVAEKEVMNRRQTKQKDELSGGWTELTNRSGSITKLDKV